MARFALLLAALLAAAQPALAAPANPYVDRLRQLSELQRRAVLRGALVNSGERCGRAELALPGGGYRNLVMWSVRCVPGGDYGLFIGPDGSAQVRSCGDLVKLKLPVCRLPPAPPGKPRG